MGKDDRGAGKSRDAPVTVIDNDIVSQQTETGSIVETYIYVGKQIIAEAAILPEGRIRTNFEPAMISNLDHLKKDDLHFDLDAEMARFRAVKGSLAKSPVDVRDAAKPRAPRFEPDLK